MEKFESLRATEQQYFTDMVQKCKDSGERACASSDPLFVQRLGTVPWDVLLHTPVQQSTDWCPVAPRTQARRWWSASGALTTRPTTC